MERPKTGIAIDGSTRGNPGPSEYRGIDLSTGEVLFHIKIGYATNNITEFIALVHGVLIAKTMNIRNVYTDSQTALSWFRKKSVNSSLAISPKTEKARDYLNRSLKAIKNIDIRFDGIDLIVDEFLSVEKWHTSEYGEIPADFGLKN